MKDGRLTFCCSNLLRALLPFGPSRSRHSALVPSRSSSGILCPVFRCSCSSKTWFCFMRRSTDAVKIYTCFSRAVGRGSSSWTLLVVAIERVSTMQLFCQGSISCDLWHYLRFPQMAPTDDAEKITSELHGSHTLETTPAQQKEKTLQRAPVWCQPNTLRRSS